METSLAPLRLGSVTLDFPVVQAALSATATGNASDRRRLGAPYTLCEVLLDQFLLEASHTRKNQGRLRVSDEEHPVGGQLMGANPDDSVRRLCAWSLRLRCDRHQLRLSR